MHTQISNILQDIKLWATCLSMKFGRTENLLDMLTEYENLRFYILGLNWRKLYQTGTWDILIDKQMSANC